MSTSRNRRDIAVALTKGVVGAAPWVGPLVAELIDTIIPKQRIDRLESFVKKLDEKVRGIEQQQQLKRKFTTPESIELFEDACFQAVRALSEERKEYIASLMKNSLTDDQLQHIHYKQLLSILGELNDVEILILKLDSLSSIAEKDELYKQHEAALKPPHATFGSPQNEVDKDIVYESYVAHLVRLGLMEYDQHYATSLGRLLLRSIDQGGEL